MKMLRKKLGGLSVLLCSFSEVRSLQCVSKELIFLGTFSLAGKTPRWNLSKKYGLKEI